MTQTLDYSTINHTTNETQSADVDGGEFLTDESHRPHETQGRHALVDQFHNRVERTQEEMNHLRGDEIAWAGLRSWAEMYNDIEDATIANKNRTRGVGKTGFTNAGVHVDVYKPYLDELERVKKLCMRDLMIAWKQAVPKPVQQFVKETYGIKEPSMARLLGRLGNPRWTRPHSHWEMDGKRRVSVPGPIQERSISQLWQFCGHGDPERSRKWRGITQDEIFSLGDAELKMRTHVIVSTLIKVSGGEDNIKGTYGPLYYDLKDRYEGKEHSKPCKRCGPAGHPALPGSPWSQGHKHASAMRVVGKEILRDLWLVTP